MNKLLQHPVIDCVVCFLIGGLLIGEAVHYRMSPEQAPPPAISLPTKIEGKVGHFIDIHATTKGSHVFYEINGPIDPEVRRTSKHDLTMVTWEAGDYKIKAITIIVGWWPWNQEPAEASGLIHVTVAPPAPPGPNPPPIPPPGPGPVPPTDPFVPTLQAAWSQETDKGKVDQLHAMTAAFKTAATTTVNDPALTNMGQLWTTVHDDVDTAAGQGQLLKVRVAIGTEMKKSLPSSTSQALDDATRKKAAAFFNRMADDLGALK